MVIGNSMQRRRSFATQRGDRNECRNWQYHQVDLLLSTESCMAKPGSRSRSNAPFDCRARKSIMTKQSTLTRANLKTPKAAAIAGILFSILLFLVLWLLSSQCLGGLSHYYAGLDRSLSVEQSERQSSVYVWQNSPRWVVNLFLPLVR